MLVKELQLIKNPRPTISTLTTFKHGHWVFKEFLKLAQLQERK